MSRDNMTPHDELMALAGKFLVRGEFCADDSGVDGMDGDAICTTYSNAAHFQDRGEVAAFIAAACNFVRSDAFRAMVRDAGRKVACHRLHTPGGRWGWVDGEPSLQCLDDARNFGWKLELAYTDAAIDAAASGAGEG